MLDLVMRRSVEEDLVYTGRDLAVEVFVDVVAVLGTGVVLPEVCWQTLKGNTQSCKTFFYSRALIYLLNTYYPYKSDRTI